MSDQEKKHTITMEFDDEATLMAFASWLCNSGEQYFMESLEYAQDGPVVERLKYHKENIAFGATDARRYGPFMAERTIKVITRKEEK